MNWCLFLLEMHTLEGQVCMIFLYSSNNSISKLYLPLLDLNILISLTVRNYSKLLLLLLLFFNFIYDYKGLRSHSLHCK